MAPFRPYIARSQLPGDPQPGFGGGTKRGGERGNAPGRSEPLTLISSAPWPIHGSLHRPDPQWTPPIEYVPTKREIPRQAQLRWAATPAPTTEKERGRPSPGWSRVPAVRLFAPLIYVPSIAGVPIGIPTSYPAFGAWQPLTYNARGTFSTPFIKNAKNRQN